MNRIGFFLLLIFVACNENVHHDSTSTDIVSDTDQLELSRRKVDFYRYYKDSSNVDYVVRAFKGGDSLCITTDKSHHILFNKRQAVYTEYTNSNVKFTTTPYGASLIINGNETNLTRVYNYREIYKDNRNNHISIQFFKGIYKEYIVIDGLFPIFADHTLPSTFKTVKLRKKDNSGIVKYYSRDMELHMYSNYCILYHNSKEIRFTREAG